MLLLSWLRLFLLSHRLLLRVIVKGKRAEYLYLLPLGARLDGLGAALEEVERLA